MGRAIRPFMRSMAHTCLSVRSGPRRSKPVAGRHRCDPIRAIACTRSTAFAKPGALSHSAASSPGRGRDGACPAIVAQTRCEPGQSPRSAAQARRLGPPVSPTHLRPTPTLAPPIFAPPIFCHETIEGVLAQEPWGGSGEKQKRSWPSVQAWAALWPVRSAAEPGEQSHKRMTRGLGEPRVNARLAREGSGRGGLRARLRKKPRGRAIVPPAPEVFLSTARRGEG